MPASTGSLFDLHKDRIEEIINKNIDTMMPALDPVWRDTIVTNQGVGKASELGRDMKIIKLFRSGVLTGVLDSAAPKNDFVLYGDQTAQLGANMYQQKVEQTWPDPFDGVKSRVFRMAVPMRAMLSNLQMSLGELQAEATPAFIGDVVAPYLKGFAQNLAHTLCLYWYVSQNDNYTIGTVGAAPTFGGSAGAWTATLEVSEKTFDRFYRGQRIDIYKVVSGNTNLLNTTDVAAASSAANISAQFVDRVSVFVSNIDELTGKVTIMTPSAAVSNPFQNGFNATTGALAANCKITFPRSRKSTTGADAFTGIAGVNSWMKFGGSGSDANDVLLGNEADGSDKINVDQHPEFKSFLKGDVGVLTEHKLRQYLHRFHAAKGKYGQTIDCLIASDGVWLAYETQKIGQYQLDRTGRLSSLTSEGSQEGFSFTFEGRTYKGHTSNYIETGTVYGIKKGGSNWKRYVPPDPKGVTRFQQADSFVPFSFVLPALTGGSSPKWPITYASGNNTAMITEGVQMPGMLRMQLVPDQPTGMKLTGVSEERTYAE